MAPHKTATPPETDDVYFATSTKPLHRPLLPGIYAPTPCFFFADESIDTAAITKHTIRLADAGLAGITTQGSNGEAVHLTPSERCLVTRTTRLALDGAGFSSIPIIVGCGAQSTRETIQLCRDAADAGGDYVLILPPSYFASSYSRSAISEHFQTVADESPIPVLIYNYPAAAGGLDLDSELLAELSQHPNIIGAKLTCGNVGKLARLASATSAATHSHPSQYICLAGSADFLLPALSVGGSGALAGLANIAPKACVALYHAFAKGKMDRARELQAILARADEIVQKGGVVGVKVGLRNWFGYGGVARKPLPIWGKEQIRANRDALEEVFRLEGEL